MKPKKKQTKKTCSNTSYLLERIEELKEEIQLLEDISHNNGVDGAVQYYRDKLVEKATPAELQFKHIAELKHLNLKFQYRINIVKGHRILKVYFADFCDTKNKLVFEVDGGYHTTKEQIKSDKTRTLQLQKAGYKVFRITNEEVLSGKTTAFLYKAYKTMGIQI